MSVRNKNLFQRKAGVSTLEGDEKLLKPSYVAKKIFKAAKKNKGGIILIGFKSYIFYYIIRLLPVPLSALINMIAFSKYRSTK